jgi:hypothetical protein
MNEFLTDTFSTNYVRALLLGQGHRPVISDKLLTAAFQVLGDDQKNDYLRLAEEFFRSKAIIVPSGLDSLPTPWLRQLPDIIWNTRKSNWEIIPYMIRKIGHNDGVLCLQFAQELPNCSGRVTGWDRLRVQINLALQPNLWTPLNLDIERLVWEKRPDLRLDLFTVAY